MYSQSADSFKQKCLKYFWITFNLKYIPIP